MSLARFTAPCAVLVMLAQHAGAQEHQHTAASPERLGTVHFATSCSPAVAPKFDRAVALLHSFEFGGSSRAFNEVAAEDPPCAMAQWGIALSRWSNPMSNAPRPAAQLEQGRRAAEAAARLGGTATARERLYITAVGELYRDFEHADQRTRVLAYERAMADLVGQAPADTEAKIFYALALTASASPTDKSYANQLKAGGILEPIWAKQPNHPGLAHYIIHAYDVPALAPRAAVAAREYALIAPSAAHALHMPSHTFTRVGQWPASIETNRRSIDAALPSGAIGEALHASDYSAYAYLQLGQDSAAKVVVDGLPALAARFDVNAVTGAAPGSAGVFALAAIPARYALERRDWAGAARLEPRASGYGWTEAMTYFARALGASHLGDTASARIAVDSLGAIRDRLAAAREGYWAEQVAIQQIGAQAWLELAARRPDSALARMREAARREDATEKSAVTPGPLAPARELLGDMLLELKRPHEALVEYRATLEREPNRFRALFGAMRAATLAGEEAPAARHAAALRELVAKADTPGRPELREIR
jgi:hypothetical protein